MGTISPGLASGRLPAFVARLESALRAAALVATAVLVACHKDSPPPADSIGAPAVAPAPSAPAVAPAPSAPAAPVPAAGAILGALQPLICFGNEPFWAVQFKADGSATCEAMCEGPPGLRVVNVSLTPSGEPQGFELLDAQGGVFLRAALKKTGKCSDGMSDNVHPYEVTGQGKPGALAGCCRDKRVELPHR